MTIEELPGRDDWNAAKLVQLEEVLAVAGDSEIRMPETAHSRTRLSESFAVIAEICIVSRMTWLHCRMRSVAV